jgi:membrane-associated protease RseP (regulator of RpoE activity)
MSVAKRFNVKVTDFMVGFGPKLWSRRRGETEYGLRAIPLGGYIKMIGMFPPMSQIGNSEYSKLSPPDRERTFFRLSAPRKAAIMLAGPFMNLVLAIGLMAFATVGIGTPEPVPRLASVLSCLGGVADCPEPSPALRAGLRPGDLVVAADGQTIRTWEELKTVIGQSVGRTITLDIDRDGVRLALPVAVESSGQGGAVGITPSLELRSGSISEPFTWAWKSTGRVFKAVVSFPAKTVEMARVVFTDQPRDTSGPVGVVGLARFSGEVASADAPVSWRLLDLISLLAGLNLSLFVFNLFPLLPLDGGHVAGAMYEGARRSIYRLLGRSDPGPVDTVRLLPATYVVAVYLIATALLILLADVVDPIRLG